MSEQSQDTNQQNQAGAKDGDKAKAKPELTKAEVAKRVKRTIVQDTGGGKTRTLKSDLSEDEIFDFKDYGTHIVVVTVAGEKFSNAR